MENKHILIGKTIVAVYLASDKKAIRFNTSEGEQIVAKADGDCCSDTWIEALDAPDALIGTVTEANNIDMPVSEVKQDYETIAFYGFRIVTNNGHCTIDYRNSSNGYYGGSLSWPGDDYFYGGVHGQNVSTEEWQLIAGTPVEPGIETIH